MIASDDIDKPRTQRQRAEDRLADSTDDELLLVAQSPRTSKLMRDVCVELLRKRGLEVPAPANAAHAKDAPPPAHASEDGRAVGVRFFVFVLVLAAGLLKLLSWAVNTP